MNAKSLQPTTDILDHAQDLSRAARSVASDLKTEGARRLEGLKDQASSHLSDVQDTAAEAFETVTDLIKKYPVAAVGVGILAGLVLAGLARRR
jgi:ElaB/YqjD/DUF883 family membrane-anchored ribosome-binding protein